LKRSSLQLTLSSPLKKKKINKEGSAAEETECRFENYRKEENSRQEQENISIQGSQNKSEVSYPCIQCHFSFSSVQELLIHAAILHFGTQLQDQFQILPLGGSSCHTCCHTFSSNAELLQHLGLAHKGLLRHFNGYKACGARVLEKNMDDFRLAEQRSFMCKLCPSEEFPTHELAVTHVNDKHLSKEICRQIVLTLRASQGEAGLTCTLCSKKFEGKMEGLLHLERHHR
jgi:hypothetical protein